MQSEPILDGHFFSHNTNKPNLCLGKPRGLGLFITLYHLGESFVELQGAVMPHALEFLVQRSHLHQSGEVSTSTDGYGYMWNQDAKNVKIFLIKTRPVNLLKLIPIFEGDY